MLFKLHFANLSSLLNGLKIPDSYMAAMVMPITLSPI
jgi:hypothetical protein